MSFNPSQKRVAAGQTGGGQFAPAGGSGSGSGNRPTPTNQNPVGMGENSNRVSDLQARLKALGYKVDEDGKFGPQTRAAVLALQKKYGLKTDGLVGPKTTAALRGQSEGRLRQGNLKRYGQKASSGGTVKTTAAERKRQKAEMYQEGKPTTAAPAAYGHG